MFQSQTETDAINVSPIEMSSGTEGACKEHARIEKEPKAKQSQTIKPPSMEACNELAMSQQSHTDMDVIDFNPLEMSSGTGPGGACRELAEESLSLSRISETEANAKLNGMGCGVVESKQLLQESAPDCDATHREADVLAKSESCDLDEATASSSTTTYNAVGNFQVGCDNESNTGEEYDNDYSCVTSRLFHALISFPHLPHLHQIAISNFQVACSILNAGEIC